MNAHVYLLIHTHTHTCIHIFKHMKMSILGSIHDPSTESGMSVPVFVALVDAIPRQSMVEATHVSFKQSSGTSSDFLCEIP